MLVLASMSRLTKLEYTTKLPETIKRVVALKKIGCSVREIGKMLGYSHNWIWLLLKKAQKGRIRKK